MESTPDNSHNHLSILDANEIVKQLTNFDVAVVTSPDGVVKLCSGSGISYSLLPYPMTRQDVADAVVEYVWRTP